MIRYFKKQDVKNIKINSSDSTDELEQLEIHLYLADSIIDERTTTLDLHLSHKDYFEYLKGNRNQRKNLKEFKVEKIAFNLLDHIDQIRVY